MSLETQTRALTGPRQHKSIKSGAVGIVRRTLKYIGILVLSAMVFYGALVLFFPIAFIQTVDDDSSLPSITFDGYTFHAETFGNPENPIVVALHGGPGGDYRYMLPLKELSDDYFVIMYDQRMTGLSSRRYDGEITIQSFYDDLSAFIEHYDNGQPVSLVGHSWGAMMASGYIGLYPERIHKVVLIEPGILRPDLADPYFEQAAPDIGFSEVLSLSRIWLNKWRVRTQDDPHARDDYFQSMAYLEFANQGGGPEVEGWRMGASAMDQTIGRSLREPEFMASLDFLEGVERFEGDVLFLTSELNEGYGADYQQGFLGFYRNAEQRIVPDSGHMVFVDQPDVSNQMIEAFLTE